MKKFASIVILLSVFSLFFHSCHKPDGKLGWIIVPSDTVITVAPGDKITWKINISPDPVEESNIGLIRATATINGEEQEIFLQKPASTEPINVTISYNVPNPLDENTEIIIKITAQDGISQNTVDFTTKLISKNKLYNEFENKTLSWNAYDLTYKMLLLMDRTSANAFDGNNPDAQIAFFYSSDPTYLYSIASPDADYIIEAYKGEPDYITGDKQHTILTKLSTSWSSIDETYIINQLAPGIDTTYLHDTSRYGVGIEQISAGDIIAFRNEYSGTVGALKVTSISQEEGVSNLVFDIKYVVYPNGLPQNK